MTVSLMEELRDYIRSSGPIPFESFMRRVLYHPQFGYYASRVPGAGGDYGTSPSLTPWFGRLVAVELQRMWESIGRPDPFTVVEAGAGRADLAAGALAALGSLRGDLAGALRWRFVERFDGVAALQRRRLGPLAASAEWSQELAPPTGEPPVSGCVIAHEVLDNFPVHLLEVAPSGELCEVYVDLDQRGADQERLVQRLGPLTIAPAAGPAGAAAGLAPGRRLEVCGAVDAWVADAGRAIASGYVLIVDYGDVEPDLWVRNPQGTVVTYGPDGFGEDPLVDPGLRDVTAEVNFSAVERAARLHGFEPEPLTCQRDWLLSLGHDDVVAGLVHAADRAVAEGRDADALAIEGELSEVQALVGRLGYGDIMVFRARKA